MPAEMQPFQQNSFLNLTNPFGIQSVFYILDSIQNLKRSLKIFCLKKCIQKRTFKKENQCFVLPSPFIGFHFSAARTTINNRFVRDRRKVSGCGVGRVVLRGQQGRFPVRAGTSEDVQEASKGLE